MESLRKAATAQSASFYLTLVSIIQSLAIGVLLTEVVNIGHTVDQFYVPATAASWEIWLRISATVQAIVLCWHINVSNAILLVRLVRLRDSYITFGFAVPQFIMISSLQSDHAATW